MERKRPGAGQRRLIAMIAETDPSMIEDGILCGAVDNVSTLKQEAILALAVLMAGESSNAVRFCP
jgi:hypothetical protein